MAFDKDKPAASTSLRSSNPEILANNSQLQTAIDNEHIFSGTSASTQTGDHTQGSARCYSQAEPPAARIDTTGFLSTDLGSLWVDTDDNGLYVLTATTPTWTPVSTEVISVLLAANRVFAGTLGVDGNFEVGTGSEFTVTAASGNVATDGTIAVAGAGEIVGIATLGDESLLKTSAAPTTDAMISNKKYVDDEILAAIASAVSFSAYTTDDDEPTAMLKNQTYLANTDGFVMVHTSLGNDGDLIGYVDTDADVVAAGNIVQKVGHASGSQFECITFPVASGEYFQVNFSGSQTPVIKWKSMGTLVKPTDQT